MDKRGTPRNNSRNNLRNNGRQRFMDPADRRKPCFAAIDLGTNNCRMTVARSADNAVGHVDVVGTYSRIVRLGEGVATSGLLSDSAMDRVIDALKMCMERMAYWQPKAIRAITTQACRQAANSDVFLRRVQDEVSIQLEIVSEQEEAMLALAGCAVLLRPEQKYAVVFDIGGGSTEVIWCVSDGGQVYILDSISLPLGVVSMTEKEGPALRDDRAYLAIVSGISRTLKAFSDRNNIQQHMDAQNVQMLGTSGTITTLAAVAFDLPRYDRSVIDGLVLSQQKIWDVAERLVAMTDEQRMAHPCIGRGRYDLMPAGCAILHAIMDVWPVPELRIADRGVREGILLGLMGAPMPIMKRD